MENGAPENTHIQETAEGREQRRRSMERGQVRSIFPGGINEKDQKE